jgi:hypothetical protein
MGLIDEGRSTQFFVTSSLGLVPITTSHDSSLRHRHLTVRPGDFTVTICRAALSGSVSVQTDTLPTFLHQVAADLNPMRLCLNRGMF